MPLSQLTTTSSRAFFLSTTKGFNGDVRNTFKSVMIVKTIKHYGSECSHNHVCLYSHEDIYEYNELALIHSSHYKDIFGNTAKGTLPENRRSSILQITFPNGARIYRKYRGSSHKGLLKGEIALTVSSTWEAYPEWDRKNPIEVEVKAANSLYGNFMFYTQNPISATRISAKLGILGAVLGFLGCLLSAISIFI